MQHLIDTTSVHKIVLKGQVVEHVRPSQLHIPTAGRSGIEDICGGDPLLEQGAGAEGELALVTRTPALC